MSSFGLEYKYLAPGAEKDVGHICVSSNWQIASGSASYTASSLSKQLAKIQ